MRDALMHGYTSGISPVSPLIMAALMVDAAVTRAASGPRPRSDVRRRLLQTVPRRRPRWRSGAGGYTGRGGK